MFEIFRLGLLCCGIMLCVNVRALEKRKNQPVRTMSEKDLSQRLAEMILLPDACTDIISSYLCTFKRYAGIHTDILNDPDLRSHSRVHLTNDAVIVANYAKIEYYAHEGILKRVMQRGKEGYVIGELASSIPDTSGLYYVAALAKKEKGSLYENHIRMWQCNFAKNIVRWVAGFELETTYDKSTNKHEHFTAIAFSDFEDPQSPVLAVASGLKILAFKKKNGAGPILFESYKRMQFCSEFSRHLTRLSLVFSSPTRLACQEGVVTHYWDFENNVLDSREVPHVDTGLKGKSTMGFLSPRASGVMLLGMRSGIYTEVVMHNLLEEGAKEVYLRYIKNQKGYCPRQLDSSVVCRRGGTILGGFTDRTIVEWDKEGQTVQVMEVEAEKDGRYAGVVSLSVSPSGNTMAVYGASGKVTIFKSVMIPDDEKGK